MPSSKKMSLKIALATVALLSFLAGGQMFAQLVGGTTYPVNGVSNPPTSFENLREAAAYLLTNGVTGTGEVILELQPGYTGTNDSVTFRNIAGLGPTLGLTIRPALGFDAVTSVTPASGQPFWAIRLSGVSYVTLDGRQGGVGSTPSWTIKALGTNGQQAVRLDHQFGSMTNNTVKYCILEGEAPNNTAAILAITTASNIAANTFTNHEIAYNIIRSGATLRGYGITLAVMSNTGNTGNKIHHNEIYDFYMYGINFTGGFPGTEIYNNKIYHSTNITQPTASTFAGIYYSTTASAGTKIYNNEIYDIRLTNASTGIHGIYLFNGNSSGAPVEIYNNFINIGAGLTGTTEIVPVWGIRDNSISSALFNIYYNSVYVGGTVSTGTANSAAYRREVASSTNLKNNIFFNARSSTGSATGTHWGISTNNTASYLSINNNLYFANGTNGVLGTTDNATTGNRTTLAAWKAAMPADNASVTGDPQFISATNLHISTTNPTPVESGGTPITGITTDIDGDMRNAATPDIGADEGAFMMLDETPPSISYTPLANTYLTTPRTLTANISDVSGVPTSGIGLPVLYWKIGVNGMWNSATGGYVSGTEYEFTFGGGVNEGDTVFYYIVAQDNATTPNVGAFPSAGAGGFTANPPAAATPPTNPSSYRVVYTISGIKTVGTGGDYATLTAAIDDLNNKYLSGPLTLLLTNPDYSTATGESFPIVINSNPGSSAINTVTIKPAPGVTPTITGSTASGVFVLNGCDYVTIDGSNTINGTTRDLTISNTYTGGTSNYVIGLFHNGTKGTTGNVIQYCVLRGTPTVTNSFGIILNASGGGYVNTAIIGNKIQNAKVGIQFSGVAANKATGGKIMFNTIGDAAEPITLGGVVVSQADFTLIKGNEIFGQEAGNANTSQYGISLTAGATNTKISHNIIHDFYYNGTSGYGCFGIRYAAEATSTTEIFNNFIYAIKADGDSTSQTYSPAGIYIVSGGNIQIYHNTVNMTGDVLGKGTSYHGRSMALSIASGITNLDIRNNIFKNSMGSFPGSTRTNVTYSIYSASPNTAFTDINYNDYFVNGVNPRLGYLGAIQMDLAAWQAATGKDANSISDNPGFVSDTDLHIDIYNASPVGNAGTPIASVTDDIDGDVRSLTTPDIGADEFTGMAPAAFNLLSPPDMATSVPINGTLLWEKSLYATSYTVYLDVVNPPVAVLGITTDTTLAYALNPMTPYYWKVKASNGNGNYETGVFTFTTGANPPNAPSNLTFNAITVDSVYMSWTDNATDEDGFRVYRSTDLNGSYTNISGDLPALAGSGLTGYFDDSGLSPNVKYYYKVVAFSGTQGESNPALDSAVTLAVPPLAPTFSDIDYTSLKVIVDPGTNSAATQFAIRVNGMLYVQTDGTLGATEAWQTYAQWGGASGKLVTGLNISTLYTFDVKARNLDNIETAFGPSADATTLAPLALPFVEDFTSPTYPPSGWSRKGTVIGSRLTAVQPNGTSGPAVRFYFFNTSAGLSDTLITPLIDMTSTGTIVFRFAHAYRQYQNENDRFRVLLSTDDGATWDTTLFDKQGAALATLPPSIAGFTPAAASDWSNNLIMIPVSRYSNTTRLMLIATSAYGNNLWIDDIKLESMPNVDYALSAISMVDGIPTPFEVIQNNSGIRYAEYETVKAENGVARSDVNNSRILGTAKSYKGAVKTVLANSNLTELSGTEATRDITMRFTVSNLGMDTTPVFDLNWDIAGTPQTTYTSTTGISFNSSVNVDRVANYNELGTHTTNASITVAGDENLSNNTLSFHRTLVYPEPMVRIRYDNGTHVPQTFIGANGPPFLAGVRFTASADMQLTNVDAYFRNETSTDSVVVRIYAAGTSNDAPGALIYSKNIGGINYLSAAGSYVTIPLGDDAPIFASGTSFWIALGFANVPYPMGAHNTGGTPGRSFYSMNDGGTWNPLIVGGTERFWLLRAVGTPYTFSAPTAVDLLEPADGSFIVVDQNSSDNITFLWNKSTDANNDPVSYMMLVSLDAGFAWSDTVYSGTDTTYIIAKNIVDNWLASKGIADGDTATAYWKVISTDGMFFTPSNQIFSVDFYRWMFTPTVGWVLQTSGTTEDLYSVKAVSQTVAWAVGAQGVVRATIDGGTTWVNRSGNAPWGTNDLYHVFAIDENTAYVIADPTDGAYIYKTTNGGTSWYQVFYQSGGFLNAVYVDGMNGYGVGDPVGSPLKWTVIQTTDGGESWFRMATEPTAASASHYGYNNSFRIIGNNMWFGTNANRVYYTTDLGLNWNFGTTTFASTFDIQFNNLTNGIVAGNGIARTLNGGAAYTNITTVPGSGNFGAMGGAGDVDYWAARAQVINRSRNTGDTWNIEFTMPNAVYAMDFVTYTSGSVTYTSGWAVTAGGHIAAYFDTTTSVNVNEPTTEIPTAFALYPNYPNPFNPTTAIRYDLKENTKVTLKIYNSLGQEVRTLVNTTQNAGSYTIHWDGKNNAGVQVASGVYIYRIQAGNFVKAHKMMLMK